MKRHKLIFKSYLFIWETKKTGERQRAYTVIIWFIFQNVHNGWKWARLKLPTFSPPPPSPLLDLPLCLLVLLVGLLSLLSSFFCLRHLIPSAPKALNAIFHQYFWVSNSNLLLNFPIACWRTLFILSLHLMPNRVPTLENLKNELILKASFYFLLEMSFLFIFNTDYQWQLWSVNY